MDKLRGWDVYCRGGVQQLYQGSVALGLSR